jgi:hypothetical protein
VNQLGLLLESAQMIAVISKRAKCANAVLYRINAQAYSAGDFRI